MSDCQRCRATRERFDGAPHLALQSLAVRSRVPVSYIELRSALAEPLPGFPQLA